MVRPILTVVLTFFIFIYSTHAKSKGPQSIVPDPSSSYYAVWAKNGEPIVAQNERVPLNPASNVKLITSYCAMKELGPKHRFETQFFGDQPLQNGQLQNLWVKGFGDPSMVNESLFAVVDWLKQTGLKKIAGDIYIDGSYFDSQGYPGRQENNERAYNAPTSATPLNFNSAEVQIQSDRSRVYVKLLPEMEFLKLESRIRVGGRRTLIRINANPLKDGEAIVVSGQLKPNVAAFSLYRSISNPSEFFGNALAAMMKQSGIEFNGSVKTGTVTTQTLLWKWGSKPLNAIVADMNKFSNNFIAEQLTKYLGAQKFGPPGTTQKGIAVLRDCLAKSGIDTANLYLENGSGLSYNNRTTAEQLVSVLRAGLKDPAIRNEFIDSLSVAGVDGTMKSRNVPKALEGVLRAKTGSLNGISSLAGYIPSANGEVVVFAILMNNTRKSLWEMHRLQDNLVLQWLGLKIDR
ncbi:MAG: D-alanyl-D-alanine carboxypeptidase/D-alanyl-D-alanine-endopeptidase [Deltaproteobacteria bacterium RIFCSPLOWO2_12_FULL_44_12]|nr:MAG: D-alanyl-D-alanine carboxypeptidase/D-alanyl-D-alanine-endopeptidase [Deltaproteobacteria bacterium RIFCSPHIGHO2_01_FULL_43_49]OGQ16385.1 MAG: D-alanyl-D-alanine carboxypeptidase/D-alanyl-D-alanine-endopeptidase [Deltaproteobacteria bacterium RIFCSPHIGHO2_02_FULL_44_53]OGQ27789.1 MAG: D-alanyl-D-alanine carboxypeptidase/D-alanyl-D-alanine-endopeptidase [Deltaproteobacteria bacterium RIFCSPHIGHO2_12_FULL_44_21]OGQ32903.1 MAG: D-alanyl-D-alanine carboxypeptidase/D-alanyl-D-alanine-endopept